YFDRPAPAGPGTSPSGNRTDRANLRVATLISIWFMAHFPSQSSATAASQLGTGCSFPSKPRSLGRSISTLPPWKPILPFVFPQRCARRSRPRACRGPQIACASRSIISPRASMPEARQNNSKLAEIFDRASSFSALVGIAADVLLVLGVLLPFVTPNPRHGGLRAPSPFSPFQTAGGNSPDRAADGPPGRASPLFPPPRADKGGLVSPHNDPGVGTANERAA